MRELIWENMVSCVNEYENNGMTRSYVLNKHKKFINKLNKYNGKQKYKTLRIMNDYVKSPNTLLANVRFINTLNNTNMGSQLIEKFCSSQ